MANDLRGDVVREFSFVYGTVSTYVLVGGSSDRETRVINFQSLWGDLQPRKRQTET